MVRHELFKGIAAGILIGIGCIVYLSCENPYLGAVLFSLGLYAILVSGASLYTGKIIYILENPPSYTAYMIPIWIGNFLGAGLVGYIISLTKIGPNIMQKARILVDAKISSGPISVLILSIFCGILMYVAVNSYYKTLEQKSSAMQLAAIMLPITVFIVCGFEHCVANMCYFVLAQEFTWTGLIYILLMTLGNTVGGVFIPILITLSSSGNKYIMYKRINLNDDNYEENLKNMVEELKKIKEESDKEDE